MEGSEETFIVILGVVETMQSEPSYLMMLYVIRLRSLHRARGTYSGLLYGNVAHHQGNTDMDRGGACGIAIRRRRNCKSRRLENMCPCL